MVHPDAMFAQDRHREVELGDVVDVDPEAVALRVAEPGDPGAESVALLEEFATGPDRPGMKLAHVPRMKLQDGEDGGVEIPVQG